MLLPRFAYHRAAGLDEALEVLAAEGDRARLLAGGTDLLVNLKYGRLSPRLLVDIGGLEELRGTETRRGVLRLGALTTAAELAASRRLRGALRLLAQAAGSLGSPQVRNRATLGGNLCTARPAADLPLPLLALGAKVLVQGREGTRRLPLEEFFTGPGATVLAPQEVLTAVEVPQPGPGCGGAYVKLGLRRAVEISLVNVAVFLRLAADGRTIAQARIALGAVAPTPMRAHQAEAVLQGRHGDQKTFAAAARAAAQECRPIDDHRGSAWYRREMVEVLTRRMLAQAWDQAQGG